MASGLRLKRKLLLAKSMPSLETRIIILVCVHMLIPPNIGAHFLLLYPQTYLRSGATHRFLSPLFTTVGAFIVGAKRMPTFVPSSTRARLCSPTGWPALKEAFSSS